MQQSAYASKKSSKRARILQQLLSIGSGIGAAAFTSGASLALTGYGARRMYVANKKLELIQAELLKRGIELHTLQKRDVLIPAAAHLLGVVVGFGLDEIDMGDTYTNLAWRACLHWGFCYPRSLGQPTRSSAGGRIWRRRAVP
jgi:hypothetical protein